MRNFLPTFLCALAVAFRPASASAADPSADARLREALRAATTQLRALEEEQAKWQAKEAQYRKDLDALRAELAEAKKGAASKGESRALKQLLAEQAEASAKASEALAQCRKDADAGAARAKEREEERAAMTGRMDGLASRASGCEARTSRMVAAGKAFLGWIARPGNVCEPFLGLRRVALENRAQQFEDELLAAATGSSATGSTAPAR